MFHRGRHEKSLFQKLADSLVLRGLILGLFVTMPVWVPLIGI